MYLNYIGRFELPEKELTAEELVAVFEDAVDGGLGLGEKAREYVKTEHSPAKAAALITESMLAML